MGNLTEIRRAGTRTKRICSGYYEVSTPADVGRKVIVERRDDLGGWMAISQWDRHLYTDILPTKAAAKQSAINMIEHASY